MPRTLAQINEDIAKIQELSDTHTPDEVTALFIENELANLRRIRRRKLDRLAAARAARLADLDAEEATVNAMLLEPGLSAFLTKRLQNFLLYIQVLRDEINTSETGD
jgi:hypothetical protein